MKFSKNDSWIIVGGILLASLKLFSENHGFSNVGGSEAAGYNFFTVLLYVWGAYAIYRLIKGLITKPDSNKEGK